MIKSSLKKRKMNSFKGYKIKILIFLIKYFKNLRNLCQLKMGKKKYLLNGFMKLV